MCRKRSHLELLQELIGRSLKKTKTRVERPQRRAHHAKRWLPIYETKNVLCLNCDGVTLTSRDSHGECCKKCRFVLLITQQRAMISKSIIFNLYEHVVAQLFSFLRAMFEITQSGIEMVFF